MAAIDIELTLARGKGTCLMNTAIFPNYIKDLQQMVRQPRIVRCEHFKITFLGLEVNDFNFVSDLGVLLCRLAAKQGYANLAMLYRKDTSGNFRVSFRSSREQPSPLALKLAVHFGGGGHLCAAGCKITKQRFHSSFGFSNFGNWKC